MASDRTTPQTVEPVQVLADAIVNDLGEGSRFRELLKATRVRNALRLNAAFSMTTGLVGIAAAGWAADSLGLEGGHVGTVRVMGAGLVVFAAYLLFESGAPHRRLLSSALLVAVGDVAWVAATVALVTTGVFSASGAVIALAVALVVGGFALVQLRRRARAVAVSGSLGGDDVNGHPPTEAVLFEREVPVAQAVLWPVMLDHGLYAKLAANLGGAVAVTENGPGLVRACTDTRGRSWQEACTLWDPGHRFAVDVQTGAEDYPYPLELMQGTWGVQPTSSPRSSRVTMAFAFRPKPGFGGRMMALVMHVSFGPILGRVVRGWTRAAALHGHGDLVAHSHW